MAVEFHQEYSVILLRSVLERVFGPIDDNTTFEPSGSDFDRYIVQVRLGWKPEDAMKHFEEFGLVAFDEEVSSGKVWKDFVVFENYYSDLSQKSWEYEVWPLRNTSCGWLDFDFAKKHKYQKIRHVLDSTDVEV